MRWAELLLALAAATPPPHEAALADCLRLPRGEAYATRYLWQPGGFSLEERAALSVQINRVSRSPRLAAPRFVRPDLVAVVLDDYRWTPSTWEKLADVEPYFTLRTEAVYEEAPPYPQRTYHYGRWWVWVGGRWIYESDYAHPRAQARKNKVEPAPNPNASNPRTHALLQQLTGSVVPVVRADWWLVQASRQLSLRNQQTGVGYYDWLGVKDRDTFLALARFKQKDAEAVGAHVRAVVDRSGVAQHGRQVAGFGALTGRAFVTFDTEVLDTKNLPTEVLTPGGFKHQAEEWFLSAPNGLWYMGLFDDKGKIQATAPDFIGADDSKLRTGRDARIHVGLSCVRCHLEDGLRPIDDWARRTFRRKLELVSPDLGERNRFIELYLSNLEKQLDEGRRVYREALVELGGPQWTAQKDAEELSSYFDRYAERPIDLTRLALEMGRDPDRLLRQMREDSARPGFPVSLAALLDGGAVRRETVEDFMGVISLRYK